MKAILVVLFVLSMHIWVAEPKLTFSPFSIHFEKPLLGIATFLLTISIFLFGIAYERVGYKRGYRKANEEIHSAIINEINRRADSSKEKAEDDYRESSSLT